MTINNGENFVNVDSFDQRSSDIIYYAWNKFFVMIWIGSEEAELTLPCLILR